MSKARQRILLGRPHHLDLCPDVPHKRLFVPNTKPQHFAQAMVTATRLSIGVQPLSSANTRKFFVWGRRKYATDHFQPQRNQQEREVLFLPESVARRR